MPKFSYPIPDVYPTITRPVAMAVIRSIIGVSGIPENTFIEYAGEQGAIPTWRTTLDHSEFTEEDTSRGFLFSKVRVGYEEEVNSDMIYPTAYYYKDNTVPWADPTLNIMLATQREKVKARLSFTYRCADKNAAQKWRNDMQRKMKMHFVDETFEASYRYILPKELLLLIQGLYNIRESVAGYGDTFEDYFKNNVIADYTVVTTLAGTEPAVEFRETQLSILGNFEFDTVPLEEKLESGNAYEITFTFRFGYERPVEYAVEYPLVIHNQIVPLSFRSGERLYEVADKPGTSSASNLRYWKIFEKMGTWEKNIGRGSIIPSFDEWFPKTTVKDTANLVQFLIRVDPNNPRKILDLQNLGKSSFSPLLLKYMSESFMYLLKRTGSMVNISVYQDDRMIDPRNLNVDGNLVLTSQTDLNLRSVYHVRVALFTQLIALQEFAADFLKNNPDYFNMFVDGLDPNYKDSYAYPVPINGVMIKKTDYFIVARRLAVTANKYFSAVYQDILMPTQLSYLFQVKNL